MESRYEDLLKKFEPDADEYRELAMILYSLFDIFDGALATCMAKSYVNLSHMYGIKMNKIRTTVLNFPEVEPDENCVMMAKAVYESKYDRLSGATFVLSTRDVLRLKINLNKLTPEMSMEGTERGKKCVMHFFIGLPLIYLCDDLSELKDLESK